MSDLANRLRAAADAIVELSRMQGFSDSSAEYGLVSPVYLRREADVMEQPDV